MDRDDGAFLCIHCHTKEFIKKNYDFDEGRELSVFSMYNECGDKPELLPYLIHSEEHSQHMKQMRMKCARKCLTIGAFAMLLKLN